jgi:hypothetical protein
VGEQIVRITRRIAAEANLRDPVGQAPQGPP